MNDQQQTQNTNGFNVPEEFSNDSNNQSQQVSNLESNEIKSNSENFKNDLNTEIEQLKHELALAKAQKLMVLADCDNLRKRFESDLAIAKSRGNSVIFSKLLEFADDFARIIENSKDDNDIAKLKNSVIMIAEKLDNFLKNQDIIELDTKVGDMFDEETMEAVGVVMSEIDNVVQVVAQKGYKIQSSGIILRPVKVIVGKSNMS